MPKPLTEPLSSYQLSNSKIPQLGGNANGRCRLLALFARNGTSAVTASLECIADASAKARDEQDWPIADLSARSDNGYHVEYSSAIWGTPVAPPRSRNGSP
jgi:hypothetical protein